MESQHNSDNCKEIFSLLSQYLDLELPPDACASIEAHIAGCEPCVEFAESLRKTRDLCRTYQPGELPGPIKRDAKLRVEAAYGLMLARRKSIG